MGDGGPVEAAGGWDATGDAAATGGDSSWGAGAADMGGVSGGW